MKLFKSKKENQACCQCDTDSLKSVEELNKGASIKILGPGCQRCIALEKSTIDALNDLNMDTDIEHVTDFAQIAQYGVMSTPGLVVDGQVVSFGKVLSKEEVKTILQKVRK